MQLIDTHSHIYSTDFDADRAKVIARAKDAGVSHILLPNIDTESVEQVLSVAHEYPNMCLPLMGLHPTSVGSDPHPTLEFITELFQKHHFIGVGEIGIDLYWDKTYAEQQREAFRYQLRLAKELNLPVVIHSRESMDQILEIVDQEHTDNLRGVFHCYSGTWEHYQRVVEYGTFMVGIGGVVTYKNAGLDKLVERMDLDYVLLETDSPYLPPVPKRGQRNECAYLTLIAKRVAELHGITIDRVAEITTRNAMRLFGIE